ncbi:MAG TPA: ABC transporter ATP-binding protein [Casimicrobiaceae bacterium]|nr:ABC transporter ATP-binding protein [Casimicrobiaceae bacterium]
METIGVHVDGVSKHYAHRVKGEIYAARDVRLDVRPGEFLTLLGPSGCGKTTTLRMIAGYEKPDSGRIRFGGQDVTDLPANQRNIGFVFQNYALFPHLSVFENVAYGLRVRGRSDDVIAKSVGDVLALVGLAGYEQQFSAQLSGGEQQRVALARAIVIQPRVLLFDEPLSNLDAKLRVQMRQEIRDLQRRLAITTVYVTHDQEEAMAVSDRIAVMHQGSVVQEGTAEDLYHHPKSQFVAQFVGRMNLVAGRVTAIAREEASIAALGALISAPLPRRDLAPGDPIQIIVRPEAIEIVRGGDEKTQSGLLPAAIVSRTFLGEKIEYLARCADEMLQIVRYNEGPGALIPEGAAVFLRFAVDAVTVLPEKNPEGRDRE